MTDRPDSPEDPMTELAAGATVHHELYSSYIEAGFTEEQAMDLLKAIIVAGIQS